MTDHSPAFDISPPRIVIVAKGDTPQSQATARGHLFEKFVAKLFGAYGCEEPRTENLNVRQNGYELDISTKIVLSRESAIAECKAYSSPLQLKELSNFYGKLSTARLDEPAVHGWFVAIPGLTADGNRMAKKIEGADPRFRLITVLDIYQLVLRNRWVKELTPESGAILSDYGVLITEAGLYTVAKQLDPTTRMPVKILFRSGGAPLDLESVNLLGSSDYGAGLPVHDCDATSQVIPSSASVEAPALVTVVGSREDFEYQFPAAPEFFVGRKDILQRIKKASEDAGLKGSVVVLNAQSGWGKSSLALRLAHQAEKSGGAAVVFDTRTATTPAYVAAALRRALTQAEAKGNLVLPVESSFASLQSAISTIRLCVWSSHAPLAIFFDQFENVFRDPRLTQEFRDLALAVRELPVPILLGFSWKTDLVGLTESYPYRLRDEIRGVANVISIEPFGPKDVGTLLARLAKAAQTSLSTDLKQRLREYSQGLPWLLKKLASHILKQLQAGTTEETLLSESLNIEELFEQDLAGLQSAEIDALKTIAREAPVLVSDIVERVSPDVIQSLVDQRLIVRVGERVDVYWDIFREFLISGKVAVEDTYILRMRPPSTSKLLQYLVSKGGEVTAAEAAQHLSMSLHVVFNTSRELRQLGILVPKSGSMLLAEQFRSGVIVESDLRARVAKALKRHTVFTKIQEVIGLASIPEISIDTLAREMPALFPALEATHNTWRIYALSFISWLDYSGLMQLRGQFLGPSKTTPSTNILGRIEPGRRTRTFPQCSPQPALEYLRSRVSLSPSTFSSSVEQKAQNDLILLGVLDVKNELVNTSLASKLLNPESMQDALLEALHCVPGGAAAISLLKANSSSDAMSVGEVLRDAYGARWADATKRIAGTKFRAWVAHAGLEVVKARKAVI
ncbi:restriction endonuclease [Pseudomonas sp. MIACH]|uniref:nSTAND1 domain-containing NTPase n=1 Tax=Pseudomonas sp. MIACH TaxID=1078355 RepID=UPI000AECF771|nr:AAA-like domain-containing protein [Pseudomonas sp. MIACH]